MSVFDLLKNKVKKAEKNIQIVFPEASDSRILKAASKLSLEKVVTPVLLGNQKKIIDLIQKENLDFEDLKIANPVNYENKKAMVQS